MTLDTLKKANELSDQIEKLNQHLKDIEAYQKEEKHGKPFPLLYYKPNYSSITLDNRFLNKEELLLLYSVRVNNKGRQGRTV